MNGIASDLLIDTDVFIDHLRGAHRLIVEGDEIRYSVVTRCELFAGSRADELGINRLLAPFIELPVDRPVAERAGRVRRHVGIRTAAALIAATALHFNLVLVTRNLRDFQGIPGLRLQPPR